MSTVSVLLDGGPSTGEDRRAGEVQWITVAFEVSVPSKTGQGMQLIAEEGSEFEAVCHVRDPPSHAAPLGAILIATQVSQCSGTAHVAKLQVGAVWQPGLVLAFQIQVRNPVPLRGMSTDMQSFRQAWRLCLGVFNEGGCEQMKMLNESSLRPIVAEDFSIFSSSRTYSVLSTLMVRFGLSVSMPPGGHVTLSGPGGYSFPLVCLGFSTIQSSSDAMPPRTSCQGGDGGDGGVRLLGRHRQLSALQASDVQLTLGPGEEDRLRAYKAYAFALFVRNPGRLTPPTSSVWELRTFTAGDELLERFRARSNGTDELLLPLEGFLYPGSTFAYQVNSLRIRFRVLSSAEGGDSDIVTLLNQIDIFGPHGDGDARWNFRSPDACTSAFTLQDGGSANGLVHHNVTSVFGALVCAVIDQSHLQLTFTPSVLSTTRLSSLEFVIQNSKCTGGVAEHLPFASLIRWSGEV